MLCAISAVTYDPIGHVMLDIEPDRSDMGDTTRRINRIATLDGGAALNDFGSSPADRTFLLQWTGADMVAQETVARLVRLYSTLTFSCPLGVFTAAPESLRAGPYITTLKLLAIEQLNA